MTQEAVVLVKRRSDLWADYQIATFTYDSEDEFVAKREQLKELCTRVRFEKKETKK
jgi:hypothetical protein